MILKKTYKTEQNSGEQVLEEVFFGILEKQYALTKEEFLDIIAEKNKVNNTIPIAILSSSKLSSLESIVKFLRENRKLSYNTIGINLCRNPKTLAATYAVAHRKMPEPFLEEYISDSRRIPFNAFAKKLSILESICVHLKSQGHTYADISRMLSKDQRTIWTVCKRAEKRSEGKHGRK